MSIDVANAPCKADLATAGGGRSDGAFATAAASARRLWRTGVRLVAGRDERARTGRDALAAFAVRVASAALIYISQVALARWIGGHDYGIYVAVWTCVLALSSLSQLGLNMALIRLLPAYSAHGQWDLARGVLYGSRLMALSAATLIAGTSILWLLVAGPDAAGDHQWPAILALVCLPMCALSDVHDGIGRAKGWIVIALAPPYVLRPLLLLLAMLAARICGLEMTVQTALGAAIVASWAATAVQFVLIERRLAVSVPSGPRRYDVRGWLTTSLPLLVIGFADIVLQSCDVIVISRVLAPDQVAIYFAAAKTMSLVMFVHYAVGSAVANRLAALGARGERAEVQRLVSEAAAWTFWPSLIATIAILVCGWPLLRLFGPEFTAAYPTMFILSVGFLARSAFGPGEFVLNMLGEERRCALVLVGAASASLLLNIALVPSLGITGAAVATALSLACGAILNSYLAWRRLGLRTLIRLEGDRLAARQPQTLVTAACRGSAG